MPGVLPGLSSASYFLLRIRGDVMLHTMAVEWEIKASILRAVMKNVPENMSVTSIIHIAEAANSVAQHINTAADVQQ